MADPDLDGTPNLNEYAFHTNPLAADAPLTGRSSPLVVIYHRVLSPSGLTFHHETSVDLVNWTENPSDGTATAPVADLNGVTESVTWTAAAPTPPATSVYFRIRVTVD